MAHHPRTLGARALPPVIVHIIERIDATTGVAR